MRFYNQEQRILLRFPEIYSAAKGWYCIFATPKRRGVRVVEGARLESVYTRKGIAGSNPALSAFARRSVAKAGCHYQGNILPPHGGLRRTRSTNTRNSVYISLIFASPPEALAKGGLLHQRQSSELRFRRASADEARQIISQESIWEMFRSYHRILAKWTANQKVILSAFGAQVKKYIFYFLSFSCWHTAKTLFL